VGHLLLSIGLAACAAGRAPSAPTPPEPSPAPIAAEPALQRSERPDTAPEPPAPPAADEPVAEDDGYPPPLTEAQREIFFGSPEDEAPEHRGGVTPAQEDKNYLAGNEKTLFAFYEDVRDRGGGYVGVGSDQAYLFIGWAKPELAWLVDYDPSVVSIHAVYRSFFLEFETPQELVAVWGGKEGWAAGVAAIEAHNEPARAKQLKRLFGRHRGWINRRIQQQLKRMRAAEIPTFLTDQAMFDYIREMYRRDRIRPMLTNLLDKRGMNGVAKAAAELGVAIRVFYVSNAEQYWRGYNRNFRTNVRALPVDEKSILLRTLLIWDVNGDYRYNVQPLANYQQWLAQPYVRSVYHIVHRRPKADPAVVNKHYTDGDPTQSPVARKAAKAAEG
jgi:hypothetical protein